jgi:hypothetical protein
MQLGSVGSSHPTVDSTHSAATSVVRGMVSPSK